MQYLVLRDCYVGDVFRRKGETYDLPDGVEVSDKNFEPMEKSVVAKEPKPTTKARTPSTGSPTALRTPKANEYACSKCKKVHLITSSKGQKHLKFRPEVPNANSS
ncbi:MAG: hypothetical protein V3S51_07835 [Dehalococcoidia bacterium]